MRQQWEVEIAIWRKTHDLTALAQNHLARCIGRTGVVVDSPPNLHTCLEGMEAVDVFVLAHAVGRSREVALATQVFALTAENDDYRFCLARLGRCLATP